MRVGQRHIRGNRFLAYFTVIVLTMAQVVFATVVLKAPVMASTTNLALNQLNTTSSSTSIAASTSGSMTFQAEDAYLTGGAVVQTNHSGYTGSGFVSGFTDANKGSARVTFVVNVPSDGKYPVTLRYSNGTGRAKTLSVYVNGFMQMKTSLPSTSNWNTWTTKTNMLTLRAGLNTISYEYGKSDTGNVNLDYISVQGAHNAAVGATLPYQEYEAEDAVTNGTIIGPSRKYLTQASEASGREAVKLSAPGQYVEFTLKHPANSIVVRYSIPDSSDGTGITALLSLYVNNKYKQSLTLTSKYSWVYGAYPYDNNPSDGNAHHFYDETRAIIGEMPAGTKVKLQVDPQDKAKYYIIDLADFEEVPAPYSKPPGYLSITSFGATPNDGKDDTQAFQKAVSTAESEGKGVWIPPGVFKITKRIHMSNVTIRGAGPWYSVLSGLGVNLYGDGGNIGLYDFAVFGGTTQRIDSSQQTGIEGVFGSGSVIQNVWVEHTKVGMWFDGPTNGLLVVGNRVRDTFADGINLDEGVTNTTVEDCNIRNTGDDAMAMWSDNAADENDVFRNNIIQLPMLANGIGIYGGRNNSVLNNMIMDTVVNGAGIQVGNNFGAVPLSGTTDICGNRLVRTGSYEIDWNTDLGALWLFAHDSNITGQIDVYDNEIDDSTYQGILLSGASGSNSITGDVFKNVHVNKAGTYGIEIDVAGSGTFSNVTVSNTGSGGLANNNGDFKVTRGSGNSGW